MQTTSRGIILDQLPQASSTTPEELPLSAETGSRLHSLAQLDSVLRELAPTAPVEQIARSLVDSTRSMLKMDLCVVMLSSNEDSHMTMQAASPDLNGRLLATPPLHVETSLWEKLYATPGQLPVLSVSERDQLNPLNNVQYESLSIVPLVAGKERAGLLYCYSSKARDLDVSEYMLLQTISTFAAMSIVSRRLLDADASTVSVTSFFDDLLSGNAGPGESLRGRAASLGCDCTLPRVMLVLEIARVSSSNGESQQAACRYALKLVEQRLREHYPDSLFDAREHRLYALVVPGENAGVMGLTKQLDTLLQQIESELQVSLCAGISNPCSALRDYPGGFSDAQEALTIAGCLNEQAAVLQFGDLGAYRYIYPFAREHARPDFYLAQVATLAHYDRSHKRAGLLHTLELYLEHWGNIKAVSERLGVHRNTVTQRLERIQSLCAIDFEKHSDWLPLHVAILMQKLRA